MRRRLVGVLLLVALSGCADAERPSTEAASTTTSVVPDEPVSGPVGRVLRRAEGNERASFRATFSALRKLGGPPVAEVEVEAANGRARITVGDLVVVAGAEPATCRISAEACVGEVREERLAPYGIFTGFWSTGPARALRALTARDDAAAAQRSTRTVAGVELDCVAVPVGAGVPNTSCVTPEGVFGFVETPAVRIELLTYEAGTAVGSPSVPFPVTDDDSFLTRGPSADE